MLRFEVGKKYSRADIKELAGVGRNAKGGPWDTGIVEHDGEFLIFANVGTEGRTGHDYDNRWKGNCFVGITGDGLASTGLASKGYWETRAKYMSFGVARMQLRSSMQDMPSRLKL